MKTLGRRLKYCTITGADDNTDITDLLGLQEEYPFLEMGILISETRQGTPRYPSEEWIACLHEDLNQDGFGFNIALHLCGKVAPKLILNQRMEKVTGLVNSYEWQHPVGESFRYQFNLTQKTLEEISPAEFRRRTGLKGLSQIILQYKEKTAETVFDLVHECLPGKIALLVDESGGTGKDITVLPTFQGIFTGYAGGLGPDNIEEIVYALASDKPGMYWLDMETNVRTDDGLDLDKVERVLKTIQRMKNEGLA